ncbi:MAG TPA: GTPase domain-containing protein [Candidatus Norongarragalinales archaeon]|nr:GTPase domain-containing protein [Candidatus Norongarragalinales archaeon]
MKAIALIGPPQAGKSTLAFSFSKFLEKKGFRVGVANMGESSKALKYAPFWDARNKKRKTDIFKAARAEGLNFVLLDFTAPFDSFFFSQAESPLAKCDAVLLVFEAGSSTHEDAQALAKVLEEKIETKVIPVENKIEIAKAKFAFPSGVISVSAWEKMGFEKLFEALKN